jgi:hypothetical protein
MITLIQITQFYLKGRDRDEKEIFRANNIILNNISHFMWRFSKRN